MKGVFENRILRMSLFGLGSVLAWSAGYRLGSGGGVSQSLSTQAVQEKNTPLTQAKGSPSNRNVGTERKIASEVNSSQKGGDQIFSTLVQQRHLDQKNQDFSRVFSQSPMGHRFAEVSVLLSFGPQVGSSESGIVSSHLHEIESQPREAFEELSQNFSKIPQRYSRERQYLVQLVGKLNIDPESKINFLHGELLYEVGSANTKESVTTFTTLLDQVQDPERADSIFQDILAQNQDQGVRDVLLSTYERKFPGRATHF